MPDPRGWILGIDVGGTGSRALLQRVDGTDRRTFVGDRARATSAGTRALDVAAHLAHEARVACDDHPLLGVGIGATGLATLLSTPEDALRDLANALDAPVAAATDAYTAHLGALGGRGGAVLSLGTGAVALDRKSTRLNSSHVEISDAVFCLKKPRWCSTPCRRSTSCTPPTWACPRSTCPSSG